MTLYSIILFLKTNTREISNHSSKENTCECCLTDNISSDARRSRGEVVRLRLASPGDKCLFCGT